TCVATVALRARRALLAPPLGRRPSVEGAARSAFVGVAGPILVLVRVVLVEILILVLGLFGVAPLVVLALIFGGSDAVGDIAHPAGAGAERLGSAPERALGRGHRLLRLDDEGFFGGPRRGLGRRALPAGGTLRGGPLHGASCRLLRLPAH